MPRPPVKATYKLSKAQMLGELEGKEKYDKELLKKSPFLYIRRFLEEHAKDVPDWVAVAGATFIVHGVIMSQKDLLLNVTDLLAKSPQGIAYVLASYFGLGGLVQPPSVTPQGVDLSKVPDWQIWLVSFTIGYIIVKHFGAICQLLGEGISGITGIIKFLVIP